MSANGGSSLGEAEYADLVARIHGLVAATVPPGSSVLVVSKGDARLLEMPAAVAAHFPQAEGGEYAGHHPLDSAAAIAALEELRRHGAEYLVIPATARWWLDYYAEFATHLATHGELLADQPDSCLIYGLGGVAVAAPAGEAPAVSGDQMRDYLEHLVPADARLIVLEQEAEGLAGSLAPLPAQRLAAGEEGEDWGAFQAALEQLARSGAEYLIVPRSEDEWFDRRSGHGRRLEEVCRKVADQRHLCRVFDLDDMRGFRQ